MVDEGGEMIHSPVIHAGRCEQFPRFASVGLHSAAQQPRQHGCPRGSALLWSAENQSRDLRRFPAPLRTSPDCAAFVFVRKSPEGAV